MKDETVKKIQVACNKLVYQWKREFNKCIKNNKPVPKSISIPQIAKRAGVAPKTIYTTDEYKRVALIAIAKTQVCPNEEDIEFYPEKDIFSRDEVKLIAKNISEKYETTIKSLTRVIIEKDKKSEKAISDAKELKIMLEKYAMEIVKLESENVMQKGQIDLLNKNNE
ncbi:hypothetical protein [Clostridium sp. DJ247]|uniref:hypothetical protein n=1 Tax=Clostridium sp. DJ247 TaxID=2726188 RepID=UPI0016240C6D|nr:hypothetical protein [Clostridium sp. DJ247]MBC2579864.1 hypothetical protein [Clostridium sp. DJ247]